MWPLRGSKKECGSESLWWPAPHVKENWAHWGGKDPKREKNKSSAPALGGREMEQRAGTWNLEVLRTRRCMAVFLNYRAAARFLTRASIIPGRERFTWNLSF